MNKSKLTRRASRLPASHKPESIGLILPASHKPESIGVIIPNHAHRITPDNCYGHLKQLNIQCTCIINNLSMHL